METRVQDDGLPSYHGIPSDRDYRDGEIGDCVPSCSLGDEEEFDQEAKGVKNAAIAGNEEGPKVETSMAFEG